MYEPCESLGQYQDDTINFMRDRSYGAIFLPMGVGKTFCVIEWIKEQMRELKQTLAQD